MNFSKEAGPEQGDEELRDASGHLLAVLGDIAQQTNQLQKDVPKVCCP